MKTGKKLDVRGIFCNRTLNMRSIRAVGYDMDYTLVHYKSEESEKRVYDYLKQHFLALGWPVENLGFDPMMVCRGLIIDLDLGNLVKANRFGFIKRAVHGTQPVSFEALHATYSRTIVDLNEPRWIFLNTLFSLSEGCMYAQLVDLLDQRKLPGGLGYRDLYRQVRDATNLTHMEGRLKADIIGDPERFVVLDPETPLALLDQHHAGKKLMLITNSEWGFATAIMDYAFNRFLPGGMSWRNLFDLTIIGARKPEFFTMENPMFKVATEAGLLEPNIGKLVPATAYYGGSARQVERHLGLNGDEILYIGDHMFGDVKVTKSVLRWRTALIVRELEHEISAAESFLPMEERLEELMRRKEEIEAQYCRARLALQRKRDHYDGESAEPEEQLQGRALDLRARIETLDKEIGPLAKASSELRHPFWGLLMRAGNDKSHLAFQMERYADIYTSRVSNLLHGTPFIYLRSHRGSLPHDMTY